MKKLLSVRNLTIKYSNNLKAVDSVSFSLNENETLGLVGESGSGKSSIAKTLARIIHPSEGDVEFFGIDLLNPNRQEKKILQRELQLVFQDASGSLNPRMTIEEIISEPLYIHKAKMKYCREKVHELLELVGLSPNYLNNYPHQLSGGQKQRVAIARALALDPKFVIFDESISALDVSVQAQIVNLLIDLRTKIGLTFLFISHDLSMVRFLSDRIAVMHKGKIVECGPPEQVYNSPSHPYTQKLIQSIPLVT
ncbi:MAG: ATP-binding cassette domain-containing protein [Rhabdochlamydiaceae bacterium]|nr:ATP-binding cassette domain-containing protein [Candidatus Amphrikana amoebophyrae]